MMGLLLAMLTGLCTAQQPPVPPGVNSSNCRGCLDPVAGICILNLDAQHGSGDCALVGPQDCAANGLIWVNNTINAYPAGDGCLAIPEAMGNNCSYLIGPVSCVFGQCVAPSRAQPCSSHPRHRRVQTVPVPAISARVCNIQLTSLAARRRRDYKYVGHAESVSECLSGARKENATYAAFSEKSVKVPGAYNCNGIYNFKGGCVMNVRAIARFLSALPLPLRLHCLLAWCSPLSTAEVKERREERRLSVGAT